MAGGFGNRLWPLSSRNFPKQFLDIFNSNLTLFQSCVLRARKISKNILLIANFSHRFIILEQLRMIDLDREVKKSIKIIFEPDSKNTFPASIVASLFAIKNGFEKVLLLPSDHVFENEDCFFESFFDIENFLSKKTDSIITFGEKPSFASTEYGYIEKDDKIIENGVFFVKKFTEKPKKTLAEKYFQNKTHLWNLGIFYFLSDFFYKKASEVLKNQVEIIEKSFKYCKKIEGFSVLNDDFFKLIESKSLDFSLIEKIDCVFCKEIENLGWNDLGSFNNICNLTTKDENGNSIIGNAKVSFSSNNNIINKTRNEVLIEGVDDLLIVFVDGFLAIRKKTKDRFNKIIDCDFKEK